MTLLFAVVLFTFASFTSGSTCTYVQYETDTGRWGGGYCWVGANETVLGCNDVGTCILNECLCPSDRGAPNCQYKRFNRELQGSLGIVLGLGGVGFINEFIVHNFAYGIGQLLVSFAGGLMIFTAFRFTKEDKHKYCLTFFGFCIIVTACIWAVVNGILILTCNAKDGNGYSYSSG